jgi:hypothetical protein
MALNSAFDPQNPTPSCMIFAGERARVAIARFFLQQKYGQATHTTGCCQRGSTHLLLFHDVGLHRPKHGEQFILLNLPDL